MAIGNVPPALTAAVTFIAYAIKEHVTSSSSLDASKVFTSLALISLVTTPASELLGAFPFTASCLGCLERIQKHLTIPSRDDQRIYNRTNVDVLEERAKVRDTDMIVAGLYHVDILMYDGSNSLLHNLDLEFRQSTFTMILGPSGSGKSTLLRAMLGEARYNGTITLGIDRIAYCPQSPWLFTGTIRQNVCGLEERMVDESWYKSVLYACGLDSVLLALPYGDNTRVEGQSSTLSGGQKQRLMLARALYMRPQLILLDDVLSALDIKTETQIMTRLFGTDGLISRLRATVVLVTHTERWEAIADNVIRLDGAGNATQTSSQQPLDTKLLSTSLGAWDPNMSSADSSMSRAVPVSHDVNREHHLQTRAPSSTGDTTDYIYYFKSAPWPLLLMFLLCAITQTICYYMSQVILKWWAADHGSHITKWSLVYIMLCIGNAVMYGCAAWTMFLQIVPESAANLHKILLDTVINAPYSFFTMTDVGTILNRFSQDMTLIESQLPTGVLCTLIYFFWTIGSLSLISIGSTWMALTIPVIFLTLFLVQRVYLRTSRRLRTIELELRSPVYSHFMETVKGLSTIRSLKWEAQFTNSMNEKLDDSQVPYYLLYCAQRWLQLVLDLIVAGLAIVVITMAVKLRGSTDPGSLGLSLNNVLSFNDILTVLLQFWTQLEVSLGAIARTREFSVQTPSEPQPALHTSLQETWPEHGGIEIRNLNAQYTRAKVDLNNITISIRPGEKIGLCGRSGSGKSSLLSVILRLLEPSSGSIIIDGVNIAHLQHETIRERLLVIPQEPFLLQHTVRFNLDLQAQYSDVQMISALSRVTLWPGIETRGGLDATVTSEFLSQGQKQLFGLARTILRKEKCEINSGHRLVGGVLLLDEATSNIDGTTDSLIQRVIREEFSAYTIVAVAHRLDTILDSDRIAVLDAGSVVEFDSPLALLSRDSAFSALYKSRESEV